MGRSLDFCSQVHMMHWVVLCALWAACNAIAPPRDLRPLGSLPGCLATDAICNSNAAEFCACCAICAGCFSSGFSCTSRPCFCESAVSELLCDCADYCCSDCDGKRSAQCGGVLGAGCSGSAHLADQCRCNRGAVPSRGTCVANNDALRESLRARWSTSGRAAPALAAEAEATPGQATAAAPASPVATSTLGRIRESLRAKFNETVIGASLGGGAGLADAMGKMGQPRLVPIVAGVILLSCIALGLGAYASSQRGALVRSSRGRQRALARGQGRGPAPAPEPAVPLWRAQAGAGGGGARGLPGSGVAGGTWDAEGAEAGAGGEEEDDAVAGGGVSERAWLLGGGSDAGEGREMEAGTGPEADAEPEAGVSPASESVAGSGAAPGWTAASPPRAQTPPRPPLSSARPRPSAVLGEGGSTSWGSRSHTPGGASVGSRSSLMAAWEASRVDGWAVDAESEGDGVEDGEQEGGRGSELNE